MLSSQTSQLTGRSARGRIQRQHWSPIFLGPLGQRLIRLGRVGVFAKGANYQIGRRGQVRRHRYGRVSRQRVKGQFFFDRTRFEGHAEHYRSYAVRG